MLDLGDIIAIDGDLGRTRTGELSIFAADLHFLTKSIETPPDKHKGLASAELRQRMALPGPRLQRGGLGAVLRRTQIVHSIRSTLAAEGFLEVEGPTLHAIAGGAAARPFVTHHNALDLGLYLRIALELHLKRLLVGGVERVYELGRVYRNEGIDARHNPEFTMLEAYRAYGDYQTMMDLTEKLIVAAIRADRSGPACSPGARGRSTSRPPSRGRPTTRRSASTRAWRPTTPKASAPWPGGSAWRRPTATRTCSKTPCSRPRSKIGSAGRSSCWITRRASAP